MLRRRRRGHGASCTAIRAALALAALMALAGVAYASKIQKRQLFREHVLPYFGGKIPDSAFQADRLALNMLNKEGISVPDGILFEARPKESFHQSQRDDPELHNSIVKMIHTPDGRFIPSEGKYDNEHEVESTYKIFLPSNIHNYQLPRFRPVTESIHLPVRQVFSDSGLSLNPFMNHLNIPFYPIQQSWNPHDAHISPYVHQFNPNANKIINFQQNFNALHLTSFTCDRSGKMYPDPETRCQVFHLCHFDGFKETFICPQGMRYNPISRECRLWYMTPCLNMQISY